jgi:hypothetical protein
MDTVGNDIMRLQSLAGLTETSLGEEISAHASDLHQRERDQQIRPGSTEWFRMWFSRPFLTNPERPGNEID